MPELRIALAQVNVTLGAFDANTAHILSVCRDAASQDAHVVVFGEMALAGMPAEDLAANPDFVAASMLAAEALAEDLVTAGLGELTVIVGGLSAILWESEELTPTNRAFVLRDGEIATYYDKQVLGFSGALTEHPELWPGDSPLVVEVNGARIGVTFETDLTAAHQRDDLFGSHPDLLVVLAGSPFQPGVRARRRVLIADVARLLGIPVAYVNLVGGQDELVFDGGSFLTDEDGVSLGRAPQFSEGLLVTSLGAAGPPSTEPASAAEDASEESESVEAEEPDARHAEEAREAPSGTPSATRSVTARTPDTGPSPRGELGRVDELYEALVLGLKDYLRKNGFHSVALGMSGGIDSALVAAIAADAIGGENVVGVSMPSGYSSQHSIDDAVDQAERLGIDLRTQPIEETVDVLRTQLNLDGIADENLQARIRGVILMGLSNTEGHLVLAPGNKSELAVGYSTIYGDAVGGFGPIKDVWKSQVWQLARARNNRAVDADQIPPIPENCITKPPSAELRPGQMDQDSLPPYDVLDALLTAYIEEWAGVPELLERGFDPDVVDQVTELVERAEWKRRQYPIGPAVSPVAFGIDRRQPITNHWRDLASTSPVLIPAEGTNDDS